MICACMAVSVRELRTAVREWACCPISLIKNKKNPNMLILFAQPGAFNSGVLT